MHAENIFPKHSALFKVQLNNHGTNIPIDH